MSELNQAWEENAAAWIAWARAPGHDSYWRFHRDLFLEIVPPPSGRTLDVGCGEGRLARDLAALGHDVAALDASATMIAAARDAAPEMELLVADAADLPFPDASFRLVVAFMSLQDVDDVAGAVERLPVSSNPADSSASRSSIPSVRPARSPNGRRRPPS